MKRFPVYLLACLFLVAGAVVACNEKTLQIAYEDPNYGNEPEEPAEPAAADVSLTTDLVELSAVKNKLKNVVIVSNQSEFSIEPAATSWYSAQIIGKALQITPLDNNFNFTRPEQQVILTAGTAGNTATYEFTIRQNTMSDEPAELSVAQSSYTIEWKAASTLEVQLTSNQATFSVSTLPSWLSVSFSDSKLILTVEEANASHSQRSHELTVTAGVAPNTASVTFTVVQNGKPEIHPLVGTIINGGIVYSGNAATGKYMAVMFDDYNPDGNTVYWQHQGTATEKVGASSDTDGRENVAKYLAADPGKTKYNAVHLCNDRAPAGNWYLPAWGELETLYYAVEDFGREEFNNRMAAAPNGQKFDYDAKTYWSSTENNATQATCYRFREPMKMGSQNKIGRARFIRCIIEGDIP